MKFVYLSLFVSAAYLASCNNKKNDVPAVHIVKDSTGKEVAIVSNNIAFINIDTVESQYKFFKSKKAELEQKQKSIDAELQRMGESLQAEFIDFQKKAQAGAISQTEAEAVQKKLIEKQNVFEQKRQKMGNDFLKESEKFDNQIQDNLRGFLKGFAKEKGYDYILTYTKYGNLLYANEQKDITDEVIEALNSGKKYGEENEKEETKTDNKTEDKK